MKSAQDKIRESLKTLIEQRGLDMANVSRAIGKNHAYIQQYLYRGVPKELPYKTAMALARYFGTGVEAFGITGLGGIRPSNDTRKQSQGRHPVQSIRRLMGLSAEQFAQSLGLPLADIVAIEHGRQPLNEKLLFKICRTFGIDPDDLASYAPQMTAEERVLLARFRGLTPAQRREVETMMRRFEREEA